MTILLIIIAIAIGWAIVHGMKVRKQHEAENNSFMGAHRGWDIYVSPHDRGVIAIQHEQRQLVVGKVTRYGQLPWSDISSVEIERNGESIQQTNRGSQAMGAAVGAVLLGPMGLLLGGLSGSKRQRARVKELSLKIVIDDRTAPLHRVCFFRMGGNGIDSDNRLLKEPARKLDHFHALISNAIRAGYRETFAPQAAIAGGQGAEERLARLWELKQLGALSEEEFVAQKRIVLGQAPPLQSPASPQPLFPQS